MGRNMYTFRNIFGYHCKLYCLFDATANSWKSYNMSVWNFSNAITILKTNLLHKKTCECGFFGSDFGYELHLANRDEGVDWLREHEKWKESGMCKSI